MTSGISISTLEIRQERTSRFYLPVETPFSPRPRDQETTGSGVENCPARVEWSSTHAFKGFYWRLGLRALLVDRNNIRGSGRVFSGFGI